jgi:hypothetical protein
VLDGPNNNPIVEQRQSLARSVQASTCLPSASAGGRIIPGHGHHGPCEHLVMKAANAGTPQTVSRPATTKAEFQGAAMASPFPCRVRARPTSVGPNLCRSFSNIAQCRCWPSIAERRQVLFCDTCGVQPRWRYPGKPPPHPQNSTVTLRSGTPVKNLFTWVLR